MGRWLLILGTLKGRRAVVRMNSPLILFFVLIEESQTVKWVVHNERLDEYLYIHTYTHTHRYILYTHTYM